MALEFSHGSIQWLTATALNETYTVSGLSFQPKALRFYWVGLQNNSPTNAVSQAVSERRGVGFAVSTSSRRSVGTFSADNLATSDCGSVAANDCVCITVNGAGTIDGKLDLNSITSDGFILIVDDVTPANITVFWEAWGGTDITVAEVGDIAEPAATGNQTYTVNGFDSWGTNQVIMLAGVQSTAAVNTGQGTDSGLHVGFSSSPGVQTDVTVCGNSDDNSGTMDTEGYCITGECLSMIVVAGGSVNARAKLDSWGTNSFILNWISRGLTNRRSIFLAIRGGAWQAGGYIINGNTLSSVANITSLPFYPVGISLIGRMTTVSTAGTSTNEDRIGFGSGISTTSRNSAGVLDEHNTANSEIDTIIQYDSVLSFPSNTGTVQSEYDINVFSLINIQIIVDVAGGVANEFQGYLTFGSERTPRPISVGHPFII
jgi:hypothetical protein